ncbi:MAG: outer membrane lipoprotein chaperone LolA [Pseudomonadota bacterium]
MRSALNLLVIFAGFSVLPVIAEVNDATEELLEKLNPIQQLQGRFVQRQFDEQGEVLLESAGTFKLLRPAYFSWEIESPDRQLIIADTEFLWHYDMDLETVTRRPVDDSIEASPLQVLAGDASGLRDNYEVEQAANDSFVLLPRDSAQGFRELTVHFTEQGLSQLDIVDRLGQQISVTLLELDDASLLTPETFVFEPPDSDVDIFYYDD